MHSSTKVLEGLMDAEYFAVLVELEEQGGYWTHDEDCDTFHAGGQRLVLLFDIDPNEPADFECHPDFEDMVWARRK
jgi:hypothetical protein